MPPGPNLYDVLGVAPTASAEELRRSYLQQARQLHPDRHIDASAAQRATVERKMQELTAAWQVLGDDRRRRRYDRDNGIGDWPTKTATATHDDGARFVSRTDGTMDTDALDDVADGRARFMRGIPWIALVGVLIIIFIFSAYALTGGPKDTLGNGTKTGSCVLIDGAGGVKDASCDTSGARTIIGLVGPSSPCPAGTERYQPTSGTAVYCLQR